MKLRSFLLLLLLTLFLFCEEPPVTKIIPDTLHIHNKTLIDNYAWLKDKTRSEAKVLEHLKKENAYTEKYLSSTTDLQQELFEEFLARTDYDDTSVPIKIDSFYYYSRTEKGKNYQIYCRKKNAPNSQEEILLDENQLAIGKNYFYLKEYAPSPDHDFLAFTTDTNGSENYQLHIKDLRTGYIFATLNANVDEVVWLNNSRSLLYSTIDSTGRTDKVYWHDLFGTRQDKLLFSESAPAYYIWLQRSRSKKYIYLTLTSNTTSEVWYLDLQEPQAGFHLFQLRITSTEYYVYDHEDKFYVRTNADGASNFKIMTTPLNLTEKQHWQPFIAHRDTVYLDFDVFEKFVVRKERYKGETTITLTDHKNNLIKHLEVEDSPAIIYQGRNPDFNTDVFRYEYESLRIPLTTMEYDILNKTSRQLKRKIIVGYEPERYTSELIYAKAEDGTRIPLSLLYRKQLPVGSKNPLILNGYGAYGDPQNPYFSSSRVSLLERGIISAIAHVRGGGELGSEWYAEGRMDHKINTFTDFISCAEFLVESEYTDYDNIVIQGASAGGMLIGAVLNMRPDICYAAVADVPFVDVINTLLDPTLSATVTEYEEWGDPHKQAEFEYILSYCPYQNIKPQAYPDILAIAGFYDTRVNYWEPAKWISRIREFKTDENTQLLYTYMDSGHSGTSGKIDYFREIAFRFAYILNEFDIKE